MITVFAFCVFALFSTSLCVAQSGGKAGDLTVAYLDGTVELMVASKWKALEIGDAVAVDATVRVSKDSSMQLSRAGLTLSFLTPGSFSVADILAKNTRVSSSGVTSTLGKTALALAGKSSKAQKTGTLGGVRASEAAKPQETMWVDELDEVRTNVKAFFETEKYAEAVKLLEKTRAEGLSDAEKEEVSFLLASANYSLGETARAWKAVVDQNPEPSSKFYANILLMKAQLLMESLSFPQAVEVLKNLTGPASAPETIQQAWLLTGLCSRAQGDEPAAKDAWNRGIAVAPGSDIASMIKDTMLAK